MRALEKAAVYPSEYFFYLKILVVVSVMRKRIQTEMNWNPLIVLPCTPQWLYEDSSERVVPWDHDALWSKRCP